MSYIRSYHFSKALLAVLLGLPFVLGVFSNARPAMPSDGWYDHKQSAPQLQSAPATELFSHITLAAKPQV